jgi:nitrogen fixation NifU-like protein
MSDQQLYKEIIFDGYKNPLNKGELSNYDVIERGFNPLCGDDVMIYMKFENSKILDISHTGVGCAISQVAVSIITDEIKGKQIDCI